MNTTANTNATAAVPLPQLDEAVALLKEVSAHFTREGDLPDGLLPCIDSLLDRANGEDAALPEPVAWMVRDSRTGEPDGLYFDKREAELCERDGIEPLYTALPPLLIEAFALLYRVFAHSVNDDALPGDLSSRIDDFLTRISVFWLNHLNAIERRDRAAAREQRMVETGERSHG
jgi:hypothetical protein